MAWIIIVVLVALWLAIQYGNSRKKARPIARTSYRDEIGVEPNPQVALGRSPAVSNPNPGCWVTIGETLNVAGISIEGGMIYVGGHLPKQTGYGDENCLIDPTLRVASREPDVAGQTISYWPSYKDITPHARLAYLQWLATGRSAQEISIGYVFLFFYGLERRVFIDQAKDDYPAITAEVRRLTQLYGANGSFNGYARRFLALLDVIQNQGNLQPVARPDLRDGFELPLDVRFYLGLRLKEDKPLSAADTFLWVVALPDTYLRTAAYRCFEELQTLWAIRFAEHWPDGLKVRQPKTDLKLVYRPASASFQGSFTAEGLPDIAAIQAPLSRLRDVLNACTDELDGYSRFIGKRPEAKETLEAICLMPKAMSGSCHSVCAAQARSKVLDILGPNTHTLTTAPALLAAIGSSAEEGSRTLGQILDYLDIGFEPDRRYGALTSTDSQLAVFRTDDHRLPIDLDDFRAARTLVEVAMLAATSDGVIDPREAELVEEEIRALPGLTKAERARLSAYALVLGAAPPKPQGIFTRAGRLDEKKRDKLVQTATAAILADGRVTPEEVKYLQRLYKGLGLPPEAVFSALHRGAGGNDEPITVSKAQLEPGVAIRAPPIPVNTPIGIDLHALDRVREQTDAVKTLLSEIFIDDTTPVPIAAVTDGPEMRQSRFRGLDLAHSLLLENLIQSDATSWADFESEARALKLMPEGAIETINEWGFDQFDEPLLELGEQLSPPPHLRTQLKSLEIAI